MSPSELKDMTLESFKDALIKLSQTQPHQREMVIWTGSDGLELFHYAIEKSCVVDSLKRLREKNTVTPEEFDSILAMIESEDRGNFTLAKLIITQKENGSTIQTGEPLLRECGPQRQDEVAQRDKFCLSLQAPIQCRGDVSKDLKEQEIKVVWYDPGKYQGSLGIRSPACHDSWNMVPRTEGVGSTCMPDYTALRS